MRRAALTALALVVLAAGCGGGDDRLTREEYQTEVREVGDTLGGALSGVDTSGGDLTAVQGQVEGLQEALRTAADDLDELEPPEDVAGPHDRLVEGVRGFAKELEELGQALEEGDLAAAAAFQEKLTQSESVQKIREAAKQLQDDGYSLE